MLLLLSLLISLIGSESTDNCGDGTYLSAPRLHFRGVFKADPSTLNNLPQNFDNSLFGPNALPGTVTTESVHLVNPLGTGDFLIVAEVTSIVYPDGRHVTNSSEDSLIGSIIRPTVDNVPGKLVDLDVDIQEVLSTIYGMDLVILNQSSTLFEGQPILVSTMNPATVKDVYAHIQPPYTTVHQNAGAFENTLVVKNYTTTGNSTFWNYFMGCMKKSTLSVKFNSFLVQEGIFSPNFTWGNVTGTIGLYDNAPSEYQVARVLETFNTSQQGSFARAPVQVSSNGLISLDLGSSLLYNNDGTFSTYWNGEHLKFGYEISGKQHFLSPEINYSCPQFLQNAGIVNFTVNTTVLAQIKTHPLILVNTNGTQLREDLQGILIRTKGPRALRLHAGDSEPLTLLVTKFGQPHSGYPVGFQYADNQLEVNPTPGKCNNTLNYPRDLLRWTGNNKSDQNGFIYYTLTATSSPDCPFRTNSDLDGQIWAIGYSSNSTSLSPEFYGIQVYDDFLIPEKITWWRHIYPIFHQYANLYPIMRPIVDLGNFQSTSNIAPRIKKVMSRKFDDPTYMPVTRDLSRNKRKMILDWLEKPEIGDMPAVSLDRVKDLLQSAIQLEHATIPMYLTALYSIKSGANLEIYSIIYSIVMEEMLHMALACNVLNAIGGSPNLTHVDFIPVYPSRMPAGLRPELVLALKKLDTEALLGFLEVEQPTQTLDVYTNVFTNHSMTIGQFYGLINNSLQQLEEEAQKQHKTIFTGDQQRQLQPKDWPFPYGTLFKVTNIESTINALNEIVNEGEGTNAYFPCIDNSTDVGEKYPACPELSHYFKFKEILEGRHLVLKPKHHPDIEFSFTGEKIFLDKKGVWNVGPNPHVCEYTDNPKVFTLAEEFGATYHSLLIRLEKTFNGYPDEIDRAVSIMYQLKIIASKLVSLPIDINGDPEKGPNAGPAFEYILPFSATYTDNSYRGRCKIQRGVKGDGDDSSIHIDKIPIGWGDYFKNRYSKLSTDQWPEGVVGGLAALYTLVRYLRRDIKAKGD